MFKKILFCSALFFFPLATKATGLQNPLSTDSIPVLIGAIIRVLLGISGALAFLMFVWGGVLWLVSGGSEKRITQGKQTLIWATLGLVIIFSSYVLVTAVVRALAAGTT